ncbi:MAG TPA: penicillin acylase family protein [Anaerolineales bacterium]|nr:penicillin acylase family protein [Anaerolineales bacterium]
MRSIGRLFRIASTILMIILITLTGVVGYIIRSPMPQTAGAIRAEGLQNEVAIYRDTWGVPHIYAESAHDLFFAQGYVHAQDRFWQMEFWRRLGTGRLSEIFGKTTLSTDLFIRTVGWERAAEQDEAALDDETRQALQWYADGVNEYLKTNSAPGLEFTLLSAQGVDVKPEKWTIRNTLTWLKAMSWDLGGNMSAELSRAMLIQTVGLDAALELRPLYPGDHPIIIPNPAFGFDASETLAAVNELNQLTGGGFDGIGSNNWVISGKLTDTGKPYLANDPHLGIQMPSIWYEVGLHCRKIADYCPYDVTGFSFPGAPGVIIGHNQRIAWGVTNLGPDVQDVYIEKINPDNPNQYEVNGAWVDAQIVPEVILVQGQVEPDEKHPEIPTGTYNPETNTTSITLNVRVTRHGPIINDVSASARKLNGEYSGIQLPTPSALALRWTAIAEPSLTFQSVLKIDRAQNWDEFRNALRDWGVPSQNFVYADVDGNIGYQAPGLIPIRRNHDGLLPVPGWADDYEWQGYIPFEELPYSYNPPQGYIVTANNAVVGPDYPYLISLDWDSGYRAQRIVDMITAKFPITLDDVKAQQGDNANLSAKEIMPYLSTLAFNDPKLQEGLTYLTAWDFQQHMDSGPAALYNLLWVRLINNMFYDELKDRADLWPGPGPDTMLAVRNLLQQPDNHWWDDVATPVVVEKRDDILSKSFIEAYAEAESRMGTDRAQWAWGKLHTATFRNATFGKSGIAVVEAIFNRGPVYASGGISIVNATSYRISKPSDTKSDAPTFEVTSVPSMRMIVDLSNFDNSQTMHTTGQSGHPFNAHYNDMIDPWRMIEYHTMLWDRSAIEGSARQTLVLTP